MNEGLSHGWVRVAALVGGVALFVVADVVLYLVRRGKDDRRD
jgi:hypothetical protein